MIHATEQTRAGTAMLTDLEADDIEAVVGYWHGGADLDFLGIDHVGLGTPDDTRRRCAHALRTGDAAQTNIAFAIRLDGALAGYTLLNRYGPETNYSHWHIVAKDLRATGLSSALYPHRIKMYFDLYPIERLIHQTRTRNIGVNRMLDKFVAVAETCHIEKPDGLAGAGEFNIRHVRREDIPRLFRRAAELRAAVR